MLLLAVVGVAAWVVAVAAVAAAWGCRSGKLAVCLFFISAGAVVYLEGITPLTIASEWGNSHVVTKLIAAGADVDKATTDGCTPLWIAAENGHLAVVTKLIAAGADVDKAETTSSITPLYIAAQECHLTVVTKLIAAGCRRR